MAEHLAGVGHKEMRWRRTRLHPEDKTTCNKTFVFGVDVEDSNECLSESGKTRNPR